MHLAASASSSRRARRARPARAARSFGAVEHVAGDVAQPDRAQPARRGSASSSRSRVDGQWLDRPRARTRPSSRTTSPRRDVDRARAGGRAANASAARTSSTCGAERGDQSARLGGAPRNGPRFSSTIRSMFGGRGGRPPGRLGDELVTSSDVSSRVEAPLEADRRRRLRAHAAPQSEPATWPGKTSTPSASSSSRRRRVEQALGALARLDREIGPGRVADEQRVAGEDEPGLVGATAVGDREAAVLRPVAGRVDARGSRRRRARSRAVLQRVVRELGLGGGMDR